MEWVCWPCLNDKSLEAFTPSLEQDENLKNDEYALNMLMRELFPRNNTTLETLSDVGENE
jgi:hypothetical protein